MNNPVGLLALQQATDNFFKGRPRQFMTPERSAQALFYRGAPSFFIPI